MMLPPTHVHLTLPQLHPALEPYRAMLEDTIKPAWLLNAYQVDAVSRFQTHFLGTTPFAPLADGWPHCDSCRKPLTFMWQINFSKFSGSQMFAERGLFQFFYCWDCFPFTQEQIESGRGLCCRWYPDFDDSLVQGVEQVECPNPDETGYGPPMAISPAPFLSIHHYWDERNPLYDVDLDVDSKYQAYEGLVPEGTISQLGGYPDWVQNDETPICPICKRPAVLVGALGSGDTGLIWGDTGYWYIFACNATDICSSLARPLMLTQTC